MYEMGFFEALLWLALNVYHEARSESDIGQLAVAHVTLNRAVQQNQSLEQIVRAPYQFSWTFQKNVYFPTETDAFMQCLSVALKAMATDDFTNGSTFYHREDISPEWSKNKIYVAQYGTHLFYRD